MLSNKSRRLHNIFKRDKAAEYTIFNGYARIPNRNVLLNFGFDYRTGLVYEERMTKHDCPFGR